MNVEVGERLGPYRLLERIGEGGMGVVHLARGEGGRVVAIKVLREHVAGDATARRRLAREVETMRRVRSPYVAEVIDADVTGEVPYVVTQYVPGRPLDELVERDGPLHGQALTRMAAGLAEALAAVHAAGIVHRDLKPGNVMLVDDKPVIIDFGIAQAIDTTRLTQTGMFIGTPGYLAPEVIHGAEVGPACDVHSWAATVAYAATGRPPYGSGPYEAVFFRITQGQYDLAGVSGPLVPLLHAALAANPGDRPSAERLGGQVARLGDGGYDAAAAQPHATAVLPTRTTQYPDNQGPDNYADILTPVNYQEEPRRPVRQPAPPRPQPPPGPGYHPWLCFALLAVAAGVTAMLPVVGTLTAMAVLVMLRAADRAHRRLAFRRSARGPTSGDAVVVALGTPWGMVKGVVATVLLTPLAGTLAVVLGIVLAYAVRGVTLDTVVAYSAAGFVGLLCAGPGARAVRRQTNRMVGAVARGRQQTLVTGLVLGVLAVLAVGGGLSQASVWWPLPPPHQMLSSAADNARGELGDWLRNRLDDEFLRWPPGITGG